MLTAVHVRLIANVRAGKWGADLESVVVSDVVLNRLRACLCNGHLRL